MAKSKKKTEILNKTYLSPSDAKTIWDNNHLKAHDNIVIDFNLFYPEHCKVHPVDLLLSKIKEGSFYENAFYAIKPIITLYEAFLSYPIHKTVVSPNYNGRIGQLSTLLNVSKLSVIKNYNPIGYDEMEKIYSKLINSDLLFFVKKCGKLCEKLNSCYGYI